MEVETGWTDAADDHIDGSTGRCCESLFYDCWVADVAVDDCEVAGLQLCADAFGCEGGGEL